MTKTTVKAAPAKKTAVKPATKPAPAAKKPAAKKVATKPATKPEAKEKAVVPQVQKVIKEVQAESKKLSKPAAKAPAPKPRAAVTKETMEIPTAVAVKSADKMLASVLEANAAEPAPARQESFAAKVARDTAVIHPTTTSDAQPPRRPVSPGQPVDNVISPSGALKAMLTSTNKGASIFTPRTPLKLKTS